MITSDSRQRICEQTLVSVIIPVYNKVHFTKGCLETLLADRERPRLEIIVIDNASQDGTKDYLEALLKDFPKESASLEVIFNDKNLGVAPAWNQGLHRCKGEFIAVLNNDIQLTSGWLTSCIEALESAKYAMISPFAGTGALDYNLTQKAETFTKVNRDKFWHEYDFCCVVMPRSTYDAVGDFDENYKVGGYEDTDYAYRLREKQLTYGVTGSSYIHHFGSQTLGDFKRDGDKHVSHNRNYFIQKWKDDPGISENTRIKRLTRMWRRWKLKWGRM